MSDPNARSQAVNVEQIMAQIRARIRERRGSGHADAQLRELAAARLAGLVGAHGPRADALETLRRGAAAAPDDAPVGDVALYGPPGALRAVRRLLRPILSLFLSPASVARALGAPGEAARKQQQFNAVLFQLIEDLVLESTRLEVEVKKLEMRIESQAARFDFAERRARALEGAVRYREEAPEVEGGRPRGQREPREPREQRDQREQRALREQRARDQRDQREPREQREPSEPGGGAPQPVPGGQPQGGGHEGEAGGGESRRRRRRRRGRRGGGNRAFGEGAPGGGDQPPHGEALPAGPAAGHEEPGEAEPVAPRVEDHAPEPRADAAPAPPNHDEG